MTHELVTEFSSSYFYVPSQQRVIMIDYIYMYEYEYPVFINHQGVDKLIIISVVKIKE